MSDALDCATEGLIGQEATPEVCEQIKNGFILVMLRKYNVDLIDVQDQIHVQFMENGRPNLLIPPKFVTDRTLH